MIKSKPYCGRCGKQFYRTLSGIPFFNRVRVTQPKMPVGYKPSFYSMGQHQLWKADLCEDCTSDLMVILNKFMKGTL